MPQPAANQVHVDAVLTNISVAYIQSQTAFVAPRVFPIVPVAKQSDKYYVWDKNSWFRDEAQRRGDNQQSAGSGFTLSTTPYTCDVWAFHKDLGHLTLANADAALGDLEAAASQWVARILLLRLEIQWVADFFTTGVWATNVTGGIDFPVWSDYGASDPEEDVETGKATILTNTGMIANTLVVGYNVFRRLKKHPLFRDRIKYTSSDNITAQMLARMLELDNVYVAQAVKATNVEGAPESYALTHGNHALLCHVAPNPGRMVPSAGYIFAWTEVSEGLGETIGTRSFFMEAEKTQRVEGEIAFDDKVVGSDLGYFFANAV